MTEGSVALFTSDRSTFFHERSLGLNGFYMDLAENGGDIIHMRAGHKTNNPR